jgi:hypothetical protein
MHVLKVSMISSKVSSSSSSSYSRSIKLLVADTIRYGLLLTATSHPRLTPFSRVALSSYSYSTSSYSFGGEDDDDDDDDVGEEEREEDYEYDVDGID